MTPPEVLCRGMRIWSSFTNSLVNGLKPNSRRRTMLEKIKTFFGRVRGQHAEKRTIVVEGELYRCTKCKMIFLNRVAGEQHECSERI